MSTFSRATCWKGTLTRPRLLGHRMNNRKKAKPRQDRKFNVFQIFLNNSLQYYNLSVTLITIHQNLRNSSLTMKCDANILTWRKSTTFINQFCFLAWNLARLRWNLQTLCKGSEKITEINHEIGRMMHILKILKK